MALAVGTRQEAHMVHGALALELNVERPALIVVPGGHKRGAGLYTVQARDGARQQGQGTRHVAVNGNLRADGRRPAQ
jgi:hypothetical protein